MFIYNKANTNIYNPNWHLIILCNNPRKINWGKKAKGALSFEQFYHIYPTRRIQSIQTHNSIRIQELPVALISCTVFAT